MIDVATNLVVAVLTGSAVVFSEMAQGIGDSIGSALLVVGERRAARPRDATHPLGYASEAFFWGLLSAVIMLVIGGGLSAWRGYEQLVNPQPLESPWLALGVLSLAIATNGYAVSLSLRKLAAEAGSFRAIFANHNRPLVKGALIRDMIGTFTSVLGLLALLFYYTLDMLIFDAIGALVAAGCMAVGSIFLIAQARALIAGRALPDSEIEGLREAILADADIEALNYLAAIYAGGSEVLIDADLDLSETLDTNQIEVVLDKLEHRVRAYLPETERVWVNLNSEDR